METRVGRPGAAHAGARPAAGATTGHRPDTTETGGVRPAAGATTAPADIAPAALTPAAIADLQARAGNRATVQALRPAVVQRSLSVDQALPIAKQLHDAMAGWGTDEEAVYGALSGRTSEDIDAIKDAYLAQYDHTLQSEIDDEFSGSELARANRLLQGQAAPGPTATDAERQTATDDRAKVIATHLREAMAGWGTNEDEIFNALTGREPDELEAIERAYLALTGNHLDRDLQDELSGADLRRALSLLQIQQAGTFTNTIDQHMTEGETTTVQGRFEYVLQERTLTVRVPVEFKPDPGVTIPIADWQTQIDSVWNGFAAVESGGSKVPIRFGLENRPGADKSIRVKQNKTPGTVSTEDRANAGMWFPKMESTTAPHEFGHLVGLQDEYQRTHGDYRKITGEDKTGPANASGRMPADIAADLHAALYQDDASKRAPAATALLTSVGLIASGVPQQGDYAQAVQAAYDDKYSGWFSKSLVEAMRDKIPEGSKWTIQSVFSYASRSVMGDPEVFGGTEPHDHAVEPRHLAEFVAIVRRSYPDLTWSAGRA